MAATKTQSKPMPKGNTIKAGTAKNTQTKSVGNVKAATPQKKTGR